MCSLPVMSLIGPAVPSCLFEIAANGDDDGMQQSYSSMIPATASYAETAHFCDAIKINDYRCTSAVKGKEDQAVCNGSTGHMLRERYSCYKWLSSKALLA